jgi:uncharacterized membrane protein
MSVASRARSQPAIIACHAALLAAVALRVYGLGLAPGAAALTLVIAVSPLLAAIKGLRTGSAYTAQWLTIVLVFYVGAGLVETVVAGGAALSAVLMLLAGLMELGLLLRFLSRGRRASVESAEP